MTATGTDEKVNKAIRHLVESATNVMAIRGGQKGAPTPKCGVFVVVTAEEAPGNANADTEYYDRDELDCDEKISFRNPYTVTINAYSRTGKITENNTSDICKNILLYTRTEKGKEDMQIAGVGILDHSPILNLSAAENNEIESRHSFTMGVSVVTSMTTKVREVKEVSISGKFVTPAEEHEINININKEG